jgi:hypothetical protein
VTALKGPWVVVTVAAAGALAGLAVAGLPAEVESDLVIVEGPATSPPAPGTVPITADDVAVTIGTAGSATVDSDVPGSTTTTG